MLAPGFIGTATLQLAVSDARLMLPYLAFAGPVTVLMALMNAQGRFALAAFSPLLFNVALIAATIALLVWRQDAAFAAMVLAATVGIAGLLQLVDPAAAPERRCRGMDTRSASTREMRSFFAKAIPGMIASSGPQLLMVAGAVIASSSPSAVSWLYFAGRLIELPLGLVGVAMGTVLVPELSRAVHGDDHGALAHAQSRALELAPGLALPATLGLLVLSEPIVRMLFEHGAFTAVDTAATARALMWLSLGLPAHVLFKSLAPAFFARENTTTPLVSVLKGIVLATARGLPVRPSVRARGHRRRHHIGGLEQRAVAAARGRHAVRIFARCRRAKTPAAHDCRGAGDGRAVVAGDAIHAAFANLHGLAQAAALLVLIAAGIASYGLILRLFGVIGWREAVNAVRQNPPSSLRD